MYFVKTNKQTKTNQNKKETAKTNRNCMLKLA